MIQHSERLATRNVRSSETRIPRDPHQKQLPDRLIICAPLAITIWLTWSFVQWADSWVNPYIPARYNPEQFLPFAIPGFGLLVAMIFITLVGFLAKNLIGRSIVRFGESILHRMPLVRTLYKSLKQIFETVLNEHSTSFRKVGLVEFPSPGMWTMGFISSDVKGEIAFRLSEAGRKLSPCSFRRPLCRRQASCSSCRSRRYACWI